MNPQEIKDFLKSIKGTDIEEFNYQGKEGSLYFRKNEEAIEAPIIKAASVVKEKAPEPKPTTVEIKSTMVGTFASAPSNEKPAFVKKGSIVEPGQKVGQIEAMKIIKDVHSKVKGKIVEIYVSNGESVEYGQKLFLIDTNISK